MAVVHTFVMQHVANHQNHPWLETLRSHASTLKLEPLALNPNEQSMLYIVDQYVKAQRQVEVLGSLGFSFLNWDDRRIAQLHAFQTYFMFPFSHPKLHPIYFKYSTWKSVLKIMRLTRAIEVHVIRDKRKRDNIVYRNKRKSTLSVALKNSIWFSFGIHTVARYLNGLDFLMLSLTSKQHRQVYSQSAISLLSTHVAVIKSQLVRPKPFVQGWQLALEEMLQLDRHIYKPQAARKLARKLTRTKNRKIKVQRKRTQNSKPLPLKPIKHASTANYLKPYR